MKSSAIAAALSGAASIALLGAAALSGCEGSPDARAEVVSTWVEALALPAHRDFADAAAALADRARSACADDAPTEAEITAARAAWSAARSRWKALDVFAIGPYDAYPARLGPHIDFRPLRVASIEARLADPPTAADIGEISAAERGLPAIEYLLWGADAPWPGARCQYLVAATADTARLAEALHAAWTDDFAPHVLAPDGEPFADTEAAFGALLNRMGDLILVVRDDRLGRPLGDKAGGVPQPQLVESPFADRSLEDIRDALDTVGRMYAGTPERPGLAAMPQLVSRRGVDEAATGAVDVDARFRRAHAEALTALAAIDRPLAAAVVESPATVRAAVAALGRLQTVIQAELTGVLAVQLAFGSGDGD